MGLAGSTPVVGGLLLARCECKTAGRLIAQRVKRGTDATTRWRGAGMPANGSEREQRRSAHLQIDEVANLVCP